MSEEGIRQIIAQELRDLPNGGSWQNPKILSRLVSPRKMSFLVDLDWNESLDLWLVYEDMDEASGFKIAYDESTGKFGLAISLGGFERELVLCFYKSFQDTLEEMYPSDLDIP